MNKEMKQILKNQHSILRALFFNSRTPKIDEDLRIRGTETENLLNPKQEKEPFLETAKDGLNSKTGCGKSLGANGFCGSEEYPFCGNCLCDKCQTKYDKATERASTYEEPVTHCPLETEDATIAENGEKMNKAEIEDRIEEINEYFKHREEENDINPLQNLVDIQSRKELKELQDALNVKEKLK